MTKSQREKAEEGKEVGNLQLSHGEEQEASVGRGDHSHGLPCFVSQTTLSAQFRMGFHPLPHWHF